MIPTCCPSSYDHGMSYRWCVGSKATLKKELGITSITVSGILYGIGTLPEGQAKTRLFGAAEHLFGKDFRGRILPFDHTAAVEYVDIVLKRVGIENPIPMADAQIAAICRVSGYRLATQNGKKMPEHRQIPHKSMGCMTAGVSLPLEPKRLCFDVEPRIFLGREFLDALDLKPYSALIFFLHRYL